MKSTSNNTSKNERRPLFGRTNKFIIGTSCMLIAIGFLLMSGSGSSEQAFNPDIFSICRIVIAPTLCLAGYLLMIIGILKKPS